MAGRYVGASPRVCVFGDHPAESMRFRVGVCVEGILCRVSTRQCVAVTGYYTGLVNPSGGGLMETWLAF